MTVLLCKVARRNRQTSLLCCPSSCVQAVLCLDIDILPSTSLAAELSSSRGWAALQRQLDAGAAVVLPAFETRHDVNGQLSVEDGRQLAFEAAAGTALGGRDNQRCVLYCQILTLRL